MHYARLIGITTPADGSEMLRSYELLAYCARVSSSATQGNHHTGARLIRSLIKREEWSPLEMVSLTIEIETTRDIGRQILRHRSFSFQEFSQRYADVDMDELVLREARQPHPTDRQMSDPMADATVADWWARVQVAMRAHVAQQYRAARQMGIAKEVARTILPEGMTPTRMYAAGTLRSWWHYCMLRTQEGTQAEHRQVAQACLEIVLGEFPVLRELV